MSECATKQVAVLHRDLASDTPLRTGVVQCLVLFHIGCLFTDFCNTPVQVQSYTEEAVSVKPLGTKMCRAWCCFALHAWLPTSAKNEDGGTIPRTASDTSLDTMVVQHLVLFHTACLFTHKMMGMYH